MATLKVTPRFFNSYEAAYSILSQDKGVFHQYDWERSAREGNLDQYIETLVAARERGITADKLNTEYNHEFADETTRQADLYNEVFANRTNVDEVRERYATDEAGNYIMQDGKPVIEKYTASDYDYYKSILKSRNDANYQKYLQQQEQERKDSMSGFVKFMATIPAIGGEAIVGITNMVDNVLNSLIATARASVVSKGENPVDTIVQTNVSDAGRIFEKLGVQDAILDFESKYSNMRNIDGSYTDIGKILGGVATSLGEMAPAMLSGGIAGKVASAAGKSAQTISTIQKATSSLVFYTGMTSGNVRDIYKQMASEGVSVPSAAILANAGIKSALQWGVEIGLGKMMGGASAIDSMVFGRAVKSSTAKTLTQAGVKRVISDFTQEGLEEVVQDTSDFLVDRAFMLLIDENFGKITSLSWQSLMDAYVIGGIASFAGSALNIATTKRITSPEFKTDKNNKIVYDKKTGDPVFKKLNKIASWEYGLDMQSFMSNYNILQSQGINQQYDTNSREGKRYKAAFTEMYAAFRMLSSIYAEIGDERFNAANDLLKEITAKINAGKFDTDTLKNASSQVMEHLSGLEADAIKNALQKLADAKITQVATSVERGDDTANLQVDDNTKKALDTLMESDPDISKILLTYDGDNIVIVNNIAFVPIEYAKNADGNVILQTIAEQTLVENILNGTYKGLPLDTVTDIFRQVSGREDANTQEAVYNLLFNESFFRIVLSTANKDMFKFVTSLKNIENNVVTTKLRDAIYKKKIGIALDSMKKALYDYLTNNAFGNILVTELETIFTDAEQRKIKAAVWCKDLCRRVIDDAEFKKLKPNDWTVLQNRVNSIPIAQEEKTRILENLHSSNSDLRAAAMNRIAAVYSNVFTSKYDGKTYMPDTSIASRTFNSFLQKNGFVLNTLISMDVSEQTKLAVLEVYGEFNQENLVKFRQSQFERDCGGRYTFMYDKEGKIGIYEAKTHKQVGFSKYNAQIASVVSPAALDIRTAVESGKKNNYLVRVLLNESIDPATASYLSIDDVISDPSLLSEQIQANIKLNPEYGEVTPETVFLYLRRYFLDHSTNTTIVVMGDGTCGFANTRPMKSSLLSEQVRITKGTSISQLVKSQYLYGRLADIKIELTDRDILAEYRAANNTIYINEKVAHDGGDLLTFAFLHEFQHAIQVENGMNLGINEDWINIKSLDKNVRKNIINDVRKHRPELFKNVVKGSKEEAKIVNDFVYYASGESTAMGIDASKLLDFYPVVVSARNNVTTIHLPWGSSYNISKNCPFSLTAQRSIFDKNLSKEDISKLRHFAIELQKDLELMIAPYSGTVNIDKINETKILSKIVNKIITDTKYASEFMVRFLSSIDDAEFLLELHNVFDKLTTKFYFDTNKIVEKVSIDEIDFDVDFEEDDDDLLYTYELSDKIINGNNYDKISYFNELISLRYTDIEAFTQGFLKEDQYEVKQFTPSELRELFDKYSTNLHTQKIGEKVFDLFERFTEIHPVNIRFINYMDRIVSEAAGFSHADLLRYKSQYVGKAATRTYSSTVLLHEVIHYFTAYMMDNLFTWAHLSHWGQLEVDETELTERGGFNMPKQLINILGAISSLYDFTTKKANDLFFSGFTHGTVKNELAYGFKNDKEFMAEWANDSFMEFLTNISRKISMPLATKVGIKALGGTNNDIKDIVSAYEFLMNTLFDYAAGPGFEIFGRGFEINLEYTRRTSSEYHRDVYGDTHGGRVENVFIDENGRVYRFDDNTGRFIYSNEPNFITSLGDSDFDTQSLVKPKNMEELSVIRPMLEQANKLFTSNENITSEQVIQQLRDDYPFVSEELIADVVNETSIARPAAKTEQKQEIKKEPKQEIKKEPKQQPKKKKSKIDTISNDAVMLENIKSEIKRLRKENKQISPSELKSSLQKTFPFVTDDKLTEIIDDFVGTAQIELDKLNIEAEGKVEPTEVKKPQKRTQHAVSDEHDIIVNTSGHGEWLTKYPKLDKDGNVRRTKSGNIDYGYTYPPKKRYVSKRKAKGTNLEKYGYVKKYKDTEMAPELQHFINNATEETAGPLWKKLTDGKLESYDVTDYLYNVDKDEISQETFKLINDSFFHNSKIKTLKQLEDFIKDSPKYYAARAVLRKAGYNQLLLENTDPKLLDIVVNIIKKDSKLNSIYSNIVGRYYTSEKNKEDINEKNLRILWMRFFDGSLETGGYIASVAKTAAIKGWTISHEGSTLADTSLDATVTGKDGSETTFGDLYDGEVVEQSWAEMISRMSRQDMVRDILTVSGPKIAMKLVQSGMTHQQAHDKLHKETLNLYRKPFNELQKLYLKTVKDLTDVQIEKLFIKQTMAMAAGIDITNLSDAQLSKLDVEAQKVADSIVRGPQAISKNIKGRLRTIKAYLRDTDKARFLEKNSDIFNDDLTIKDELIHKKDSKGRVRLLDEKELLPLEDRIRELAKLVREGAYMSQQALDYHELMERRIKTIQNNYAKAVRKILKEANANKTTVVKNVITYEVSNEEIVVDTSREMPFALKRLLATEFNEVARTKVRYLSKEDDVHVKTSFDKFVSDNAEILNVLTQEEAEDIIDFYLHSEILPGTNKARQYIAIQIWTLTYILTESKEGRFILSEEQYNELYERVKAIPSLSATAVNAWKSALPMLKPREVIIQSMAKSCDVTFRAEDVENLINAVKTGDVKTIDNTKTRMYEHALDDRKDRKTTLLDKLLKFERMAMLSGPGTWLRNKVSNVMVTTGNIASEQVGGAVSKIIEKMFPKKKWRRDNQYTLVNTKVSSEIQAFIKQQIIDSGLFNIVHDGLTKYDGRRGADDITASDSLTRLVISSIKAKIFQESAFKSKQINAVQNFILKQLSDDKWINNATIRYLGKMLTEDNVDLSKGLSKDVLDHFAEAYKMASYDYMHKKNFFNKIESKLKEEWGDKAFFMYKQILPFAPASWNWFMEGLNYTPIGLAMAIKNFAKLEDTIEKLEDKRQKGEPVISSRFAEYIARRNIGKGVIGTIGAAIGVALAVAGFAGIDEEDKKYKLFVHIGGEKVTVDISDIFGTQGILLGITVASAIRDGDWFSAVGDTLDTMFLDSTFADLFNSFRYNDGFGDWLSKQPFSILQMFVPNFLKVLTSISSKYKVKYSSGVLGKIEQLAVNTIPGIAYAFPKRVDPYTGENQVTYKFWFLTGLVNRLTPLKIYPYRVSDAEKVAISLGVNKAPLSGRYEVNGQDATLSSKQNQEANEYYGKLNQKDLQALMSGAQSYKVWDEKRQQYVELKYRSMSDTQKKTVIERIMSNNSRIAKIYILTSSGDWKYYANESEYAELKKLGIKNIYRKTGSLEGFVKS